MGLPIRFAVTVLAGLLAITASPNAGADEPGYPIEIDHAFGTTIVEKKPERVATVAWANHEVPLALGIVPVGFARADFGDDDGDGLLPWVEEKLTDLEAKTPVLFDEGDGIDFEAVASTNPDIILAAYSGLSRSDYDMLSRIAPVVAYPETAWSTDWREMIRLNSRGLGMSSEGEHLVADIEAQISKTAAAHPTLQGKTALFVSHLDVTNLSMVNFYTASDTRVKFFRDLGLGVPAVAQQAAEAGRFAGSISAERIDEFDDVDIIVSYGNPEMMETLSLNPLLSKMPAIENEAVVLLGRDPLGTAANPTPLSIPWVLDRYVARLADAAGKAR
ncbi:iron-siderophore ABC transporter substrate-binding protein [Notoacmeibacter ruber]|uniref:Iron-siderophore ABC transporter substrate-binding protein n=1 Tax=Notoacmeibacter ruber TaxID=2670375 RepID=A0A3L7JEH8_9HYPH|nr:iron-siderophore ABC transporter substrate-binding protein [Notoacmeibacter ruber]RLQ89177.1 iron-siderophore ABC transporter substrate-binding protein [Notoacmeibacter ruber]